MKNSVQTFKSFFKSLTPFILIFIVVAAFFWKVIFKGLVPLPADFITGVYYPWLDYKWGYTTGVPVKNPITTDVVSFTYPMQTYAVSLLKSGRAPLWNPYILAGTPLLANFQSAPFAITNVVYLFADTITGWTLRVVLQHILAILAVYFLLKHWKVTTWGGLIGGIIYAFAGFNLIWSQWNAHALVAACIPLLILFTDLWFTKPKILYGVGFAALFGIQILSGYPQLVIYSVFALMIFWLTKLKFTKRFFIDSGIFAVFGLLGLGVSALQILPAKELLNLSQRSVEPHPFEWAFLPFSKVITFFAPDYFGNHATKNYWGPQDYTSTTGFGGVIASTLALIGTKTEAKRVFLILLFIFSLLLSFPTPLSIFIWKSGALGLQAASAHRALVLTNLAVALMAGFGFDSMARHSKHIWKSIFLPILFVGGFGIGTVILSLLHKSDPEYFLVRGIPWITVALRNLVIPSALCLLLLLCFLVYRYLKFTKLIQYIVTGVLIFELFYFGWKFTPMSPRHLVYPTTPVIEFLQNQQNPFRVTGSKVIPINMRMPFGLESLEGYDAIYPLQISRLLSAMNGGRVGTDPLGRYGTVDNDMSSVLNIVNSKYVLTLKKDARGNPDQEGEISNYPVDQFRNVFEDKTTVVLENMLAHSRAEMYYSWQVIPDEVELLDKLLQKTPEESSLLLLSDEAPFPSVPNSKSTVTYASYEEQKSTILVETESDGLLFVSDSYYPGWHASVDGVETQILKANFAFRAIPISKGNHVVRMWYDLDSFNNGLKISVASIIILAILLLLNKPLSIKFFR